MPEDVSYIVEPHKFYSVLYLLLFSTLTVIILYQSFAGYFR